MTAHLPDCVILLCFCIRRTELLRLCILLLCPSVFTHVSACEIIVVIHFLCIILSFDHPLHSFYKVNMHPHFLLSPSPFFPALNPVPTAELFLSLFPSYPSFHSSFSTRFYLRHFSLNVLNINKYGFLCLSL